MYFEDLQISAAVTQSIKEIKGYKFFFLLKQQYLFPRILEYCFKEKSFTSSFARL